MNCPKCNAPVADGAEFCTNCGEKLGSAPVNAAPQTDGAQNAAPSQDYSAPNQGYSAPNQGPSYQQPYTTQQPYNTQPPVINSTPYLVWSIIVTVLCCLPLGIPAIVYAAKINSMLAAGNIPMAQDAAKKSKLFSILGACIGGGVLLLYVIFYVIIGGAFLMSL